MSKAEIALPLPEETKKVGDLVAYSNLEVQESAATAFPKMMADIIEQYHKAETTIDEKVKIMRVIKELNVDKTKKEDSVQLPTLNITINRRGGRKSLVLDSVTGEVDDPDDPDGINFEIALTPSMLNSPSTKTSRMLNYTPSLTGEDFMDSRAFLKLICGPVGGGKSTVALFDLLERATNQEPFNNVRRTKFGILRNTTQQLKATVKPLIDTWFVTMAQGTMGSWRLVENVFEIKMLMPDGTICHSEFMLLAADTPDDVRRLLSLELSAAWVEECREVDEQVFAGLQGRVARFPARVAGGVTYPGVICSTNPPPLGTYWHDFMVNPPKRLRYSCSLRPCWTMGRGTHWLRMWRIWHPTTTRI